MKLAELGADLQEARPCGAELAHGLLATAAHLGRPTLLGDEWVGVALLGIALVADLVPWRAELLAMDCEHPDLDLLAGQAGEQTPRVLREPSGGLGGVAEAIAVAIDHEDE